MRKQSGISPSEAFPGCRIVCVSALILFMGFISGCSRVITYSVYPLVNDINASFMQQRDVVLAEQGAPAFLLMIDGLIEHSPGDRYLLLAGAKSYSSYAAAFVGDKDPERNRILTEKARQYAFRALSLQNTKFSMVKEAPHAKFVEYLPFYNKEDVPFMYYAAVSWAGWIQANSESWDAIADLPKVQGLIERIIELDEKYNHGSSHAFMGALLTIRPPSLGGRPEEARKHFERAIEIGGDRFLPSYVMFARYYAKLMYNKELFYDLLERVIDSPVDEVKDLILVNTMARQHARELIEDARREEYFD